MTPHRRGPRGLSRHNVWEWLENSDTHPTFQPSTHMLHLRRTALVRPLRSAGQAARLVGRRGTLSVQWDASASASTDGIWEEGPDFVMQPEELLHDLRIEDDGAKRVAEFLPKWCVQLLNP